MILRWLEHEVPAPPLWPASPADRAVTDVAIAWFNEVWKRAPNAIDDELSRPHPTLTAIAGWSREIQETLPWFEALLADRDFLLGDTLGAFDVVCFPFLKYRTVEPDAGTSSRSTGSCTSICGRAAPSPASTRGPGASTRCRGPETLRTFSGLLRER